VLDWKELDFLISSGKGRAILYDLHMAQENYLEAVGQWNMRSELHRSHLQPALGALGLPDKTEIEVDLAGMHKIFGHLLLGQAINATDICIEMLSRAFVRLADVKRRARAYIVSEFETNDFTDFDFPDTYGLVPKSDAATSRS
jgi:hypothetical protein